MGSGRGTGGRIYVSTILTETPPAATGPPDARHRSENRSTWKRHPPPTTNLRDPVSPPENLSLHTVSCHGWSGVTRMDVGVLFLFFMYDRHLLEFDALHLFPKYSSFV